MAQELRRDLHGWDSEIQEKGQPQAGANTCETNEASSTGWEIRCQDEKTIAALTLTWAGSKTGRSKFPFLPLVLPSAPCALIWQGDRWQRRNAACKAAAPGSQRRVGLRLKDKS